MSIRATLNVPSKTQFISNGLALFSMFFGAGNVVFPLIIGQIVQGQLFYAWVGLVLTAVFVPILGVISTALFEGDYYRYFKRLGKIPGWCVILLLFALIGPFGAIPRLVDLCYASLKIYFPSMNLYIFSACSCGVIFLFTYKKNRILQLLGVVLTPILLGALLVIIIKGVFFGKGGHLSSHAAMSAYEAFSFGLVQGYNTLDLLASFFFSSLIYNRLKESSGALTSKGLLASMLKVSTVGASLLAFVYLGFGAVASKNSALLRGVAQDQLLGSIGHIILGPFAGFIVSLAIIFSCLTTAIALASLCADFMCEKMPLKKKMSYQSCLILILGFTWLVSSLGFSSIVKLLVPILIVCYPPLIMLSVMNILHKAYDVQRVKLPVFGVFAWMLLSSVASKLWNLFS